MTHTGVTNCPKCVVIKSVLDQTRETDNATHNIDPKYLKIDFFDKHFKMILEIGTAYLDGRVNMNYVPGDTLSKLDRISEQVKDKPDLWKKYLLGIDIGTFHRPVNCPVELVFANGNHRAIIELAKMSYEERYYNLEEAMSIEDLMIYFKQAFIDKQQINEDDYPQIIENEHGWRENLNVKKLPKFPDFQELNDE